MTIDLTEKGKGILRLESDIIPRVGETVSTFNPKKEYTVIAVDHLLKNRLAIGEEWVTDLITIEVNIQGDSMGHECKDENLPIQHVRKSGCKFCGCESYTKRTQGILVCQRCNEDWQPVS